MTTSLPSSSSGSLLPIRMISTVTHGFGRGSRELGIPTANLGRENMMCSVGDFHSLPCGIYWGFAKIIKSSSGTTAEGDNNYSSEAKQKEESDQVIVYNAAISIGYNPYYKNKEKTVEPHFIAPPNDKTRHASNCGETLLGDFYDDTIRLSVVGFLRDEAPFDGLDNLIAAIKSDIKQSETFCNNLKDPIVLKEKEWVNSEDPC